MTALEHLEEKFLKQKLAMLEATFDAFADDMDEHEAVIERLEGRRGPMKVTTKTYLPSGYGTVQTYDENDQHLPKEFGYLPEDKARAYGPLAKPEQNVFERKSFRWIRGVE